jgi:hypothetical protein
MIIVIIIFNFSTREENERRARIEDGKLKG